MSVSYANSTSAVEFTADFGFLSAGGGAAGDVLLNVNTLTLSRFADTFDAGFESSSFFIPVIVFAAGGNDRLNLNGVTSWVDGGSGNDRITGLMQNGLIEGGTGKDVADVRFVGFLSDTFTLSGGAGDDVLTIFCPTLGEKKTSDAYQFVGGAGNDRMNDQTDATESASDFVFGPDWGNDTITGFDGVVDDIVFSGTDAIGLKEFSHLTISGNATETLVSFGTNSITLVGFDVANFNGGDVVFL